VSGAASFVYEVGWVRLLNQALGTTIHSFELMLAAFILGLAFGGLWIRKRARNILEPVRYVGYVQVWMAIAALLSIPVFTQSFKWVGWMMGALARSENGYTLFELGTAAISLLVMFPAAFFAGMTLPLFTVALLRAGAGERSIGRIYAANTLGAIAGVALTMHVLIPSMGVRLAVTLAAIVDGVVGLYLLRAVNPARLSRPVAAIALAMVAAIAVSVTMGRPDPRQQVSGVFRTGRTQVPNAKVAYLRDGKTATVSLFDAAGIKTIATNGKPDASLTGIDAAPTPDESTMVMAAVLPLALHPDPKKIAVIGWGSGLTTHSLLGSSKPEIVDTIEIEAAMVEGASLYGSRVARAYKDPRSQIHIDDARTFFSTGGRKYDAIISEPSNPWVSGVAALFTQEFYAFLKRHLNEGGMVVQWLHTYEINDPLVGTMLAAMTAEFPYTDVYLTNSADLLIVARMQPGEEVGKAIAPGGSEFNRELRRVGLDTPEQIALRRIGGAAVLRNFIRMVGAKPHSDYFPTVSLQAPRTRFMGLGSVVLPGLVTSGMPVLDILDCRRPFGRGVVVASTEHSTFSVWRDVALGVARAGEHGVVDDDLVRASPSSVESIQAFLSTSRQLPDNPSSLKVWSGQLAAFARGTLGFLPPEDLQTLFVTPAWLPAAASEMPEVAKIMAAYSAAARREPAEMHTSAEQVLALPDKSLSPLMREQMLVIATLGALGTDDKAEAISLDKRWGASLGGAAEFMSIRGYLLAWAHGDVPACMSQFQRPAAVTLR
jgi:spermidine synthase